MKLVTSIMRAIKNNGSHLLILTLVFNISLLSCEKRHPQVNSSNQFNIEKLVLELDSIASNYNQLYDFINFESNSHLAVMNKVNNGIDLYDLKKGELSDRISFPINGPGSISKIDGFKFIKADSFIVFPESRLDGFVISRDTVLDLRKHFKIRNPIFNHHISSMTPVLVYDQKLFLYGLPIGGDPRDTTDNLMLDLVLDFKTKSISRLVNKDMKAIDKNWGALGFQTRALDNLGRIVYSFPFDSDLLVYDIKKDSFYTRKISTNLFSKKTRKMSSTDNRTKYRLENNYYDGILFDPFKDVFYRFIKLQTNPISPSGKPNTAFHQKTALQVIDINFNVISEVVLTPTSNFLSKDSFVLDEGLCISTANTLNENLIEDQLVLSLLDFKLIRE